MAGKPIAAVGIAVGGDRRLAHEVLQAQKAALERARAEGIDDPGEQRRLMAVARDQVLARRM